MRAALKDRPQRPYFKPHNIISASIDPKTGLLAHPAANDAMIETFRSEYLPKDFASTPAPAEQGKKMQDIEKLF